MVRELQSAVRPPTPDVPNTELGVFYESADEESPSGGDLWDWLILPGGDLHFAIVDVMGKGVEATKDALAVTHALRLLALDGCALEVLVQRADSIVTAQNPDLVATLLVGRYDPETGSVRIAGAGHPPALIVGPAGCREVVAPGIPIGWPGAGSSGSVATHLDRSESLILYTDGLIEARRDIIEGLDTLKRFAVETSPYPAAQQARVLVDRVLSDAARRDDSLAVILRRRTPPIGTTVIALGPFAHRLARSDATVPMARRLLEDWLRAVPVEGTAIDDLLLTASELCANAVKHSQWTSGGAVMRAWTEGGDVVISVEDDGVGLELPYLEHEPPPRDAERGRGLWLVQTLMDDVNVDAAAGHTVVTARKRAVAAAPS
jgi:anti-sigma regulatory factor (Ser/Thr protein kinase)